MLCRQLTIYKTHFKIPRAKILAIMLPILIVIFLNRISSRLSSSYVDTSWMHHGYIMLIKVPPSCWCEQNILYVNSLKWGVVMAQLTDRLSSNQRTIVRIQSWAIFAVPKIYFKRKYKGRGHCANTFKGPQDSRRWRNHGAMAATSGRWSVTKDF